MEGKGFTVIGWFNILICQFLFFRIFYSTTTNKRPMGIIYPIRPLSGWKRPYIVLFFKRYKKLIIIK